MKKNFFLIFVLSVFFNFCMTFTADAISSRAQYAGSIRGDFPDGMVGIYYRDYQSVSSGFNDSTWEVVNGTLPPGLKLDKWGWVNGASAELEGTPTRAGSYNFTILVRYKDNSTLTKRFNVTILENPNIKTPVIVGSFSNGKFKKPYSSSISAAEGKEPYEWFFRGNLPNGLNFKGINSSNLTLSGVPLERGEFNFEIAVKDKFAESQVYYFTLVIN